MFSRVKKWFAEIKELKYLAYHDELTGLYNRHYLNKLDTSQYTYVYFIDINDLKSYNKEGHTAGDNHIRHCAQEISKRLYFNDCLIRYAGDEFILLTCVRKAIYSNELFSVGEAKIEGKLNYFIEIADKDMIKNKNKRKNGRNA